MTLADETIKCYEKPQEKVMVNTRDCDWLAEHGLELSTRYPGK